jgi:hypothetical protein
MTKLQQKAKPKFTRTNTVHDAVHLSQLYGAVVTGEVYRSPAGEWRREKDGRYRFWSEEE